MDTSLLQQAIATLRNHAETDRIKKLIYWVCEQEWSRSAEHLEDLDELLPKLLAIASTATDLRTLFRKSVADLSKPQQYTEIALVICNTLAPLYGHAGATGDNARHSIDLFELRLAVMKYTVPMHAKILIYSALEQVFTGRRRDWLALKQTSLDDLLLQLCQTFATLSELEEHLQQISMQIEVLDQPIQVMEAILQAVKPLYTSQPIASSTIVQETKASNQQRNKEQVFAEDMTIVATVHNTSPFFPTRT